MKVSQAEIDRRYGVTRQALERDGLDALIVTGTEYTGFEGAIRWLSGFRMVHRYAYAILPVDGDPIAVFPAEARWVGEHDECWIENKVFAETPGAWMAEIGSTEGWKRVGVYGYNFAMPVRDYRALTAGDVEIVDYDHAFDLVRAVKSEEELPMVQSSFDLNEKGFWKVLEAYEPGRTEAEIMAPAEEFFVANGTTRTTMNMVLSGPHGSAGPEFKHPNPIRPVEPDDLLLYSIEIAGPSGYWAEFARPITRSGLSPLSARIMEAYQECFERARTSLRAGATAHDVHMSVFGAFSGLDVKAGHVTGHSIDMIMVAHPRIGEGVETVLEENMIISIHPHVVTGDDRHCLYMQETFRVTPTGGEQLSSVPIQVFDGTER
ncbi:MAG: aminopeptidase P family protein [Acidobacteria bacterium]|nr:aminopeptidase P family protein [Acidobacteriota bacterium]MCH8991799.1 aminopeptidase P family protein [Acidobacteriota bacterium]